MSKDETAPGLLSKLAKFVRNPATNWTELDSAAADRDDSVNKQLLKEMIERKRRNDFVRKREFDMLRKLRKFDANSDGSQGPASKPSFFHSSMTSKPDDRASTIKKIDEIEAQMSMQWWKGKAQDTASGRIQPHTLRPADNGDTRDPALDSLLVPNAYQTTMPAVRDTVAPEDMVGGEPLMDDLLAGMPRAPGKAESASDRDGWDSAGLELTSLAAGGVPPPPSHELIVHDAELEEAAILFANGDDAGAEAGLLEILAPGALRADHVPTWLTLLDLYRASGEQEKFETAALEFAHRFDRSTAQWYSLPDMVKALAKPADAPPPGATADWICPSLLGIQAVGALNTAVQRAAMPLQLDWSNLKTIDAGAIDPLLKLFTGWATEAVQLRFKGDGQLQKVLQNATPSGEQSVNQKWWQLRMEVLRVLHRADDFELTALDFCVTYEVSPPSWESAACTYKSLDEDGDGLGRATIIGAPSSEPMNAGFNLVGTDGYLDSGLRASAGGSQANQFLSVELSGQVQGQAAAVLDRLEASLMGADQMQISCSLLIRVDFSAAGMLLNWVSARHAENRAVEFSDVNRLVAAFFNVIGITEYARVTVRID